MRKMKPFGGKMRKYAEGGAADEPDETGTYKSGVRIGRNVNIDDDVRARAMRQVDRAEAKETLKALAAERPAPKVAAKPAPKAAAKPAPKAAAKPAPKAAAPADSSVPKVFTDEERAERAKQPTKRSFMDDVRDNAGKIAAGVGAAGAAGAIALARRARAARSGLRTVLSNQKALPAPPRKPELSAPARKDALPAPAKRPQLGGPESRKLLPARKRKEPVKPTPRDRDEERMSGEGGGFRKGGSVRGCGVARKGLTKGKMR